MLSLIINPVKGISVKTVSEWENIINEIKCDFFDVVSMYFYDDPNHVQYDFYVDDLGYYKNYEPVALSGNYPALVGTTVIKRHDEHGEDVSLDEKDIIKIVSHIYVYNPDPEDLTKFYFCLRGTMR